MNAGRTPYSTESSHGVWMRGYIERQYERPVYSAAVRVAAIYVSGGRSNQPRQCYGRAGVFQEVSARKLLERVVDAI